PSASGTGDRRSRMRKDEDKCEDRAEDSPAPSFFEQYTGERGSEGIRRGGHGGPRHYTRAVRENLDNYEAVLLDLDGTVYHEEEALPGAIELIRRLQGEGRRFACLSNSTSSPGRIAARLRRMG